ncbi:MAG: antitoxin VbhA family protein [Propionibacteriaceae bacterium]|nr:antitoxin VbhA family protein [Propionibacteriaceae bacterium]
MRARADQVSSAEVEEHVAFADAALSLAGHSITDPVLRDLMARVARGEMNAEEAVVAMRCHVQG